MIRRWRLFPKYALLIITLVGSMLVASGAIGLYFSRNETQDNLKRLQNEKAQNAATRIEQYIRDIEHDLSWTALPRAEGDGNALEQRRLEFLKLQRQAPAITEVVWIDPQGREQLRLSRLAMDVIGSGTDLSQEDRFRVASKGEPYYGPVYFRKGTEPYMTIARPAGNGGGVTAVEVNLKFVWDVVSKIKVGEHGIAYVVDSTGTLVAHPDISLVLKKTDLSALPQVAAVRAGASAAGGDPIGRDPQGGEVFSANAPIPIPTLGWTVFVDTPRAEAFAPMVKTLQRTSLVLILALLISIAASFFLARALVQPLRALQEGAAQIGAGDLERHIDVRTGDELEVLAQQFNHMSAQLRESYAGLERKVDQRTAELREALEQQTATAEILRVISGSVADHQPVFEKILESCAHLFSSSEQGILLIDNEGRVLLGEHRGSARERLVPMFPSPPAGGSRPLFGNQVLHFKDMLTDPDVPPGLRAVAERLGIGSFSQVFAPLVWEGRAIGSLYVVRQPATGFNDKEIGLLRTFADQAVIAIQNARLFNETKEALEQQTATAEVLQVISGSLADTQPVFNEILGSCERLFNSAGLGIYLQNEDGSLRTAAVRTKTAKAVEVLKLAVERPGQRGARSPVGAVIRERRMLQHDHVPGARGVPEPLQPVADRIADYSIVIAPMGSGALLVFRDPAQPFTARELDLIRTFADQAVIAIQNARLFNETKEALEQQTATAEILQVISRSVADSQPVFDAILRSCERLFNGAQMGVTLLGEDGRIHLRAHRGPVSERDDFTRNFPFPLSRDSGSGAAILTREVVAYEDVELPHVPAVVKRSSSAAGTRSIIFAPLVWEDRGIGAIYVARRLPGAFSAKDVALVRTFADQAVIAIQNARLFNETKESLTQQGIAGDVLRVIGTSLTDAQPVFDEVTSKGAQVFADGYLWIALRFGDSVRDVSTSNANLAHDAKWGAVLRTPLSHEHINASAILDREAVDIIDIAGGSSGRESGQVSLPLKAGWENFARTGYRSVTVVPILRGDEAVGAIGVARRMPRELSEKHFALLWTFADQIAIALDNVRLFNETKEALEQQTATAEVLQVISSSVADTQPVFDKILDSCERLFAAESLGIYLVDEAGMLHKAGFRAAHEKPERALAGQLPRPVDGTATAVAIRERRVVHFGDVLAAPEGVPEPLLRVARAAGSFSIAFAPMLWEGRGVGAIHVSRDPPAPFNAKELTLLKTFADQAVIAIQNARLFSEIQAKSRELELANKHKSEFLANMSHELRTPLNAIIGFSEVLSEQMFGEVNDKQLEYLRDIHASGHHLLTLINDILDLSKIEAGRMELDLATTNLPMLLDNCTTLVRERASRNGLVLALDVDDDVGDWVCDVRKLKQIVINLLSNAVKFTPAGGRVTLRATKLEHAVEITVVDTGVGIAEDQQALVFEEFRQAGGDYLRKAEGTGLGLSLAKRFVELHGGAIRVESQPGHGSTFAFILPERVLEAV